MNLDLLIMLIVPLLLIEGFFSGSEIALLSVDKVTLKKTAAARARRGSSLALELSKHPERVLSTTLFMTSLCVIGISSLAELFFLEHQTGHAELYAVLSTSPLIVIFGELLPKTIYQRYSNRIAPWISYPIYLTYWIFYPITRLLSIYTSHLSRIVGPIEEMLAVKRRTTREELLSLLSYNRRETEIKSSERRMIKRIFDFKDTEAKHALIPLVRVEAIEDIATVREALERFERHRHSRMPVYSERIDNIVGVLETSDLFNATDLDQPIKHYVSSAHFVAETQSLEDLLRDMRSEDIELVVVVDEHGGAVGILTFEDIVEEIVGEINDEYDQESRPVKEIEPGHWLVQAGMEIDPLNDQLKIEVPQGDYETLGGFLLQQFGRIPEPRDELFFNTTSGQYKFTIKQATEKRIETVIIEKID
jgi:putative hemolysin